MRTAIRLMGMVLLYLLFTVGLADAQDFKVSGIITSMTSGEKLPGVTVKVKNTNIGTATDVDGKFELNVNSPNDILVISSIGFEEIEYPLEGKSNLTIELSETLEQLMEIIVTAVGVEKDKRTIIYSLQSLDAKEINMAKETNLVQALAGKVAGVQVIQSAGVPGASSKILIRGAKSFTEEDQPLIVVDGIPINNGYEVSEASNYPFNANLTGVNYSNRAIDLNSFDIASVTVLKGPAAAALYGVRAGNGALIITTQRGKKDQPLRIDLNTEIDASWVNKLPDLQTQYAQGFGGGVLGQTAEYYTYTPGPDGVWNTGDEDAGTSEIWGPQISSLPDSLGIKGRNNMEEFFRTAYSYNNNISISGGNEKSSIRFSMGKMIQNGVVPNTDFQRTSLRVTASNKFSKKFDAFVTANFINSGGKRAQMGSNLSGVMLGLTRTPPSFDLANGYEFDGGIQRTYFQFYDNPYWTAYKNPTTDNVNRLLGSLTVNYLINDWMKLTYRGGTDLFTDRRKAIFAIGSNDPPLPTGEIRENSVFYNEQYNDLLLTSSKELSSKWVGSLTIGGNINQRFTQSQFARGRDLAIPNYYNLNNAGNLYADEQQQTVRTSAVFFDANISYNDMLYLSATGRNEWASTFGPAKNNFFYPSVGAAFVFTELEPLKSIREVLYYGKLRASYAIGGNIPKPYATRTYFEQPFYSDGFTDGLSGPYNGVVTYAYSTVLGSANLRPEQTTGIEFGGEFHFLKDRITLDVTYYNQKSEGLLTQRPIAFSSGFKAQIENSGSMVNKGWEIMLDAMVVGDPTDSKSFTWNIGGNFTRNVNEVLKLAEGVDELEPEVTFGGISFFAIKGRPYGSFYGTQWLRNSNGQLIIGANGLPKIDPVATYLGNAYPDWLLGIRNSFSYRNLEFSFLWDIRTGGKNWNGTYTRLTRLGATNETVDRERTFIIDGVKEDGSPNDIEISAYNYWQRFVGDRGSAAETAIMDVSWVRLRDISLGYTLNANKLIKHVQDITFRVSGRNLLLFTPYKGIDPETSLTGSGSSVTGYDYFNMPNTASVNFSLNVSIY